MLCEELDRCHATRARLLSLAGVLGEFAKLDLLTRHQRALGIVAAYAEEFQLAVALRREEAQQMDVLFHHIGLIWLFIHFVSGQDFRTVGHLDSGTKKNSKKINRIKLNE